MLRTFQFRLRPNASQRAAFERILADNCETYNSALAQRRDAWQSRHRSITYNDQQARLTELRKDPQFAIIACDIQREPLRRVDRAFKAFFRRCKAGEKPGYPRFRSRDRYDSFGFGNNNVTVRDRSIKVPNVGDIRARGGRPVQGKPKLCTVKRDGKRWTASVVCYIGPAPDKRTVSSAVGVDVGLKTLATLSDGRQIENPRWVHRHEARIRLASQRLSRNQRGSRNRVRAREVLRRAHQRATDSRRNYLHHVSKWLVGRYDLIAFEALNIQSMAKSRLAKSIMDAAWGELIWQLKYKAEEAGVWAVPVNPRRTSQLCSGCGGLVEKTLAERRHVCSCGVDLDRDHNAALNILALGRSAAGLEPSKRLQHSRESSI